MSEGEIEPIGDIEFEQLRGNIAEARRLKAEKGESYVRNQILKKATDEQLDNFIKNLGKKRFKKPFEVDLFKWAKIEQEKRDVDNIINVFKQMTNEQKEQKAEQLINKKISDLEDELSDKDVEELLKSSAQVRAKNEIKNLPSSRLISIVTNKIELSNNERFNYLQFLRYEEALKELKRRGVLTASIISVVIGLLLLGTVTAIGTRAIVNRAVKRNETRNGIVNK